MKLISSIIRILNKSSKVLQRCHCERSDATIHKPSKIQAKMDSSRHRRNGKDTTAKNYHPHSISVSLALVLLFVLSPKPFEGSILLSVSATDVKEGNLVVMLSRYGAKAIYDGNGQAFEFLIPKEDSSAYKLSTYGKTYNIVGLAESQRLSETLGKFDDYVIEKFSDETILGYVCKHFTIKTKKRSFELWTTSDILDADELARLSGAVTLLGLNPRMIDEMRKAGVAGFPLKLRADEKGKTLTIAAKKVTQKTFPKSSFEVPKGYKKLDGE